MENYKIIYNKLLERYYNGCNYLNNNLNKYDIYIQDLLNILDEINEISIRHPEMTKDELLNGFKE